MDEFRQFGSIISVTTDAILAHCMSSPQPPGENRVARSIALIIGSAEKNRVGREPEPQVFFFTPKQSKISFVAKHHTKEYGRPESNRQEKFFTHSVTLHRQLCKRVTTTISRTSEQLPE